MEIRNASESDVVQISDIYNHYVRTSYATFELEPIEVTEMQRRITDTVRHGFPFVVAECGGAIGGYAYGRPFRPRPGYRHAVEIAVYVHPNMQGQGIGNSLYAALVPGLFENDAHTLIATIALPNEASVRLHEKFGFVKAGEFREVGRKFERWTDVGYWQLLRKNE
jgi:phosphinothricin acetyltransferase